MANQLTEKDWEYSKRQIEKALKRGAAVVSYNQVAKLAGLTQDRTRKTFKRYPELDELRRGTLKRLKTLAVGNLVTIMEDEEHKDHFQATKMFLTRYKTELDEVLESQKEDMIVNTNVIEGEEGTSISIHFAPQNKNTASEEDE